MDNFFPHAARATHGCSGDCKSATGSGVNFFAMMVYQKLILFERQNVINETNNHFPHRQT